MAELKKHPCYECEFKHHLCKAECSTLRDYENDRIEKYKEKVKNISTREYYQESYSRAMRRKANYIGRWS